MAGINRLGKAPPRPGQVRAPDPNKYRSVDFYSEGTEGDADYMRMVQDIEDSQQQHGWLFQRGAFDKGDLLYLRDQEEKNRFMESEMRDTEKSHFAKMKARFEQELQEKEQRELQKAKRIEQQSQNVKQEVKEDKKRPQVNALQKIIKVRKDKLQQDVQEDFQRDKKKQKVEIGQNSTSPQQLVKNNKQINQNSFQPITPQKQNEILQNQKLASNGSKKTDPQQKTQSEQSESEINVLGGLLDYKSDSE